MARKLETPKSNVFEAASRTLQDLSLSVGLLGQRVDVMERQIPAVLDRLNVLLDRLQETVTQVSDSRIRQSRKLESIEKKVDEIYENQKQMASTLDDKGLKLTVLERDVNQNKDALKDTEDRLRKLENWKYWMLGAIALLTVIVNLLARFWPVVLH